jgi:LytS/YehU family sensor histidine kinase
VEQQYAFTILAPFWRQPWFVIGCAILLTGLLYFAARQRERHVKKVAQLQQQRMMFEYDHLRSQVNPHFLFNSLNTLTGLIEEEPRKALVYSSHLADLYRNILAYRSEEQLYLFEELDILDNYIQVQKSRFGSALQVKIDVPDEVKNERRVVPLALQMLVENAMKHNIVSASHPLIVSISADHNYITISNNIQLKLSKEKGLGIGLENIAKRYALATRKRIFYGAERAEYVVRLPLL